MLTPAEKILLGLLIATTAWAFFAPIVRRLRIVLSGSPDKRLQGFWGPFRRALGRVFLQRCALRSERKATGLMHALIFYGALTFDTMTVNHALEGFIDGFHIFGSGLFALLFSLAVDAAAVSVMIGVAFLAFRRFVLRPRAYDTAPWDSAAIYLLITLATATYLYFEGFSIAVHPETARWSFLGNKIATALQGSGLGPGTLKAHFKISWWAHLVAVCGFIAYVPHSKYLHMFAGPFNVLFGGTGVGRRIEPLDLEAADVYGLEKPSDFTWKDNLDAFACMECGRCQDVCPAFASGKPLSPKKVLVNMEKALLAHGRTLWSGDRAGQPDLAPGTFSEDEIWACTTCGACEKVCPVEIEHIRKIVGVRRGLVLARGEFPRELSALFRNLETNSNPWGAGFSKRAERTESLGIRHIKDVPDAEYLLWIGCMGAYDSGAQEVIASLAKILGAAGIPFGTLGAEERCCGDQARRLGHEYLFQGLAQENIALFKRYGIRRIVTICPHGANTLKHEYPRLMGFVPGLTEEDRRGLKGIEVLSHVELIRNLLASGQIALEPDAREPFTFHDPCYLGRHNGLTREPRAVLSSALGDRPCEPSRHGRDSFCCGAGGGLMWLEESPGARVNHLRTEDILATGASLAVSACPFCLTMLRDGLKDKGREDVRVEDIARIVADRLA